jgi:hypothetical protein
MAVFQLVQERMEARDWRRRCCFFGADEGPFALEWHEAVAYPVNRTHRHQQYSNYGCHKLYCNDLKMTCVGLVVIIHRLLDPEVPGSNPSSATFATRLFPWSRNSLTSAQVNSAFHLNWTENEYQLRRVKVRCATTWVIHDRSLLHCLWRHLTTKYVISDCRLPLR